MQNKYISSFLTHLRTFFFSGLFSVLPIIVTVFVVTFTYDMIARWLKPLKSIFPHFLQVIPGSEFILVILAIFVLGVILKVFFIKPLIHWFEQVIVRVPLIKTIYSSAKTLVDFFNLPTSSEEHRQVVLCEFPRKGLFTLGFVLEPATDNFQKLLPEQERIPGKVYYKIFIPHSPNPTVGYFLVLGEHEIIPTKMTFDEAIKAVVSCGLITPESLKQL